MYLLKRIAIFVVAFTTLFVFVRQAHVLVLSTLLRDLGSIPWLYSTIGLMFSMTSGFTIQTLWNTWDNLTEAVREEINSLQQILLFSKHLPKHLQTDIQHSVEAYLEGIIANWQHIEIVKKSREVDGALVKLQENMYDAISEKAELNQIAYALFSNVLMSRDNRLHYSLRRLPKTLKLLIQLNTSLIIGLSFFIGVQNVWLDYIFTLSIGLVSFVMYEVIVDLEYPLYPGSWHVTNKDYKMLLEEIHNNH